MPSTVLLTGAAGFIGSHVAEALLARGDTVVGLDNLDPFYDPALKQANLDAVRRHAGAERFEFREVDLTDAQGVDALLAEHRPDSVIHLAAKAGVRPSIADPVGYTHANLTGTSVLFESCRAHHAQRIVFASSSSVYGNNDKTPFAETDPVNEPISPYAATKRAGELIAHTHHHLTGMPVACLRFFTVFGPRQRPDLAFMKFMRRMREQQPIPVFGDGSARRDFTHIANIVAGVLAALDRVDRYGYRIWNLGSDTPTTLATVLDTLRDVTGIDPVIDRLPDQPGDVRVTWAELSRSRSELDYSPESSLSEGLAGQWAWLNQALPLNRA